jgi:hypothetical protein
MDAKGLRQHFSFLCPLKSPAPRFEADLHFHATTNGAKKKDAPPARLIAVTFFPL